MQDINQRVVIVIPSLNPDQKLMGLLSDLQSGGFSHILVVNDGSKPECLPLFARAETEFGCVVLRHHINFGKGRALKTAFNYYLNQYPDFLGLITVDADGQHKIADIAACAEALSAHPEELILGSRNFAQENVPFKSRYGNRLTRTVFHLLCGVKIHDTQTGLRAMSNALVQRFLMTKGERFEFEMNMLVDCADWKVPLREVEIETVYLEENASSHFNPILDSLKIYAVFGKFLISSVSAFLVDYVMFCTLLLVLHLRPDLLHEAMIITIAKTGARVISSFWNYMLNRKAVFSGRDHGIGSFFRYYALVILTLGCSIGGIVGLEHLTHISPEILTIPVDFTLFLLGFGLQRSWVFKGR